MHLLVAEDDPRSLEFLTKGLNENGFSVDVASDGEAAWQWIREDRTAYLDSHYCHLTDSPLQCILFECRNHSFQMQRGFLTSVARSKT